MKKSSRRRKEVLSQALEGHGRAAAVNWVGHPAVAATVPRLREGFVRLLTPLDDLFTDPISVTSALNRWIEVNGVWPDGREYPNPFAVLDASRLQVAADVGGVVVAGLGEVAASLHDQGVPLQPSWFGDLITLGQLILLDVDLTRSASEIVDDLNPGPIGATSRDGGTLERSTVHINARADADLGSYARDLSRQGDVPQTRAKPGAKRGSSHPPNPDAEALDRYLLERNLKGVSAQLLAQDAEARRFYRKLRGSDPAAELSEQVVRYHLRPPGSSPDFRSKTKMGPRC